MHTVTLILTGGTAYTLNFSSEVNARSTWKQAEGGDGWAALKDDFGIEVEVRRDQIMARQIANVEQVFDGQAASALLQARAQAKLQQKAASDPTLRFLSGQPAGAGGMILEGRRKPD